jgi:Flp pilus assembly protein TadG
MLNRSASHRQIVPRRLLRARRGMLSVELVLTLPLLLMVVVGAVLLTQMLMSHQAISAAAGNGAREATMPGASADSVREIVLRSVAGWRLATDPNDVAVAIRVNGVSLASDPGALAAAGPGDEVSVTVGVATVKAVPDMLRTFGLSIAGRRLESTIRMRKE